MSLVARLRHLALVELAGKPLLRISRLLSARRLRAAGPRPPFGPPLVCSARLKELIVRHYLVGRYSEGVRPVAWVTSGAPVEFLLALGYHVHYPENHGAMCGIRRVAEGLCQMAEQDGYSRNICSYARTDFGTLLGGRSPAGRLPRPRLLLCCTNICQTVLYWYRVLAEKFSVPLIIVDTPFLYRPAQSHQVEYVRRQLEQAIPVAEKAAGRTLSEKRLREVARLSKEAVDLWAEVLKIAARRPAPFLAFDAFIHMAPIVEMRGETFCVEYYRTLLDELQRRAARGEGAIQKERHRLVWDNLPVWYRMRWMAERLAGRGVALVASTYTNAWGELGPLMDVERPLESGARVYLHAILNRSAGEKLRTIRQLVADYSADGAILHSDRSCKPYSVGQMDQRRLLLEESGVPALLLEADHNDPRAWADAQSESRLEAFLEMLQG